MKKSLIIGAFTNYNYNQLKPWVESIGETGFSGDKVMIAFNSSKETIDKLSDQGFIIVQAAQSKLPIHVERFVYIHNFLKENYQNYQYVITTDVKDVYFQKDPTEWLEKNLGRGSMNIVAGSEGLRYRDEPWGNENLMQTFGPYVHEEFKNNLIYNVGVLGGRAEYIKDLCLNIFLSATNRPIPIVDQAVFNVLIQTQPYLDTTLLANQEDGWACHAGTTVDPSKIVAFRPFLEEREPIFEDGIVKTHDGTPFTIVHQYDRVPEWKKFIANKYKQEDESLYFKYRTN